MFFDQPYLRMQQVQRTKTRREQTLPLGSIFLTPWQAQPIMNT
jgi:hypothetical protein